MQLFRRLCLIAASDWLPRGDHAALSAHALHRLARSASRTTGLLALLAAPAAFSETASSPTGELATSTVPTTIVADAGIPIVPELLEPLDVHQRTSLTIVEQLRHNHYLRKPLDDSISSEVYDKYLDTLDGAKAYFTAADIADFERYRFTLDDSLKRGDLKPAYQIFNSYQARLVDRLNFLLSQIDAGVDKIDFTLDESVEMDRKLSEWPADGPALDELWRKRLKSAVLGMKLNGKEIAEIQETLGKRYRNRLKQTQQTKSEDAFQLYVNAFASTYDPHTQYFSPRTSQNFNINMSLSLEGIGAVLRTDDDYTAVVRLVPAGPADKAGALKPADRIVSVGQGEHGPLIDVVGWRLDDVVELIRGPKGSVVRLEVQPKDSEAAAAKVINITRNTVQLEEQAAQKKLVTFNRDGQDYRVGVIELPTFYVDFRAEQQGDPNFKSTTRDVRNLIDELREEGIDGLVIDLRNNGGGSLREADQLTGLFIKSGPTVQVKSARRRPSVYSDTDDAIAWEGPLAVLVNRLSASASEIFAGAIQDYERGIIIGSQTFGKGTVQTLIPLNRGQLKITAAKFYRVSGQSTQHQGVLPDIEFPELFDTSQIGESSLDDAMPWDMIQPAVYPSSNKIQPVLTELRNRHSGRVEDDADFRYLRALALKTKENALRTHLSLNEAARRKEKEADDTWRLNLENGLRVAKGKPPAASLTQLEEEAEAAAEALTVATAAADKEASDISDISDIDKDAQPVPDVGKAPHPVEETGSTASNESDPDLDAMLRESGNILLDYIGLTRQIARLEQVAPAKPGDSAADKQMAATVPEPAPGS